MERKTVSKSASSLGGLKRPLFFAASPFGAQVHEALARTPRRGLPALTRQQAARHGTEGSPRRRLRSLRRRPRQPGVPGVSGVRREQPWNTNARLSREDKIAETESEESGCPFSACSGN